MSKSVFIECSRINIKEIGFVGYGLGVFHTCEPSTVKLTQDIGPDLLRLTYNTKADVKNFGMNSMQIYYPDQ